MLRKFIPAVAAAALLLAGPAAALSAKGAVGKLNDGIEALQKGDAATAVPLIGEAIDSGKLEGENLFLAYFTRGAGYAMLQQCPNAIPDFDKAIAMKATDPQVFAQRGSCLAQTGEAEKAVADLKQAAALAPDNKEYAEFHCAVAFNGKIHAEAGPACENAVLKFSPDNKELVQASAQSYEAAGNKAKANEMWKKLLALDPASEAAKQGVQRTA